MALHIVTGPPAGGKSTYIDRHAQPGDIRIDLDRLANHLAGLPQAGHEHTGPALAVARAARTAAIDAAFKHATTVDVWIIDSKPTPKNLQRYRDHHAEIITCDPGKDVVMKRAKAERSANTIKAAATWYQNQKRTAPAIKSFAYGKQHPNGLVLDARELPNPHQVPGLRIPDGTSRRVGDWLAGHDEVNDFITNAITRVDQEQPNQVWVGCSAGKHRSVYIAEQLAQHYGTTPQHLSLTNKQHTPLRNQQTYRHQKARERTRRMMNDGEPCWWCGRPMHHDQLLHADHTDSVKHGGLDPDRMMHDKCNRQRREGGPKIDTRRPALGAVDAFPMLPILMKDGTEDSRYPTVATGPPERPATVCPTREPFQW